MVPPGNIYVIMMPKDTSECSELHHLKNVFQPPNPLAIQYIATPQITKNFQPSFKEP